MTELVIIVGILAIAAIGWAIFLLSAVAKLHEEIIELKRKLNDWQTVDYIVEDSGMRRRFCIKYKNL